MIYGLIFEVLLWWLTAFLFLMSLNPPRRRKVLPEGFMGTVKDQQSRLKKIIDRQ